MARAERILSMDSTDKQVEYLLELLARKGYDTRYMGAEYKVLGARMKDRSGPVDAWLKSLSRSEASALINQLKALSEWLSGKGVLNVKYHIRGIIRCNWFRCNRFAKREILNQFNIHIGHYCVEHAPRRLRELQRIEAEKGTNEDEPKL